MVELCLYKDVALSAKVILMNGILNELSSAWNYVLIEAKGGNLTVGKIFLAFILAFVGHFLARHLSQKIRDFLSRHYKFPISTLATIKTITYYTFYLIIIFFVFRILEVPLTVFTVLGSAVAIGVGFGSQNIVKNFLSGITVLIEQPIKVGDFLEVDGLYGVVENVGFRSTRMKTAENTHVIIPNSSFLENKVLNWTLSDDIIRGKVAVGVAYGSDLEKVKSVLSSLHNEIESILNLPKAFYHFADFGSSSLDFEYYFFTKVSTRTQLRAQESEVRFLIDQKFREEKITIAFPQLDLHFNPKVEEAFSAKN